MDKQHILATIHHMNAAEIRKARELSNAIARLGQAPRRKTIHVKKNTDYLSRITNLPIPKIKANRNKYFPSTSYKSLEERVGEDAILGKLEQRLIPRIESIRTELRQIHQEFASIVETKLNEPALENDAFSENDVREIIKIMRLLPEKDRLEVQDIRNWQTFRKDGVKYKFEELMHGGGGTTSSGLNVATQYILVAVQSGANVTIDLTQLTNWATFDDIICLYRNNIPQTEGASYNFTVSGSIITVFNADAGDIFNLTYSYT